jgi:hypothetical protein
MHEGGKMSIIMEGVVEHGDARGRLLGFPTANLILPRGTEYDGVWAARVHVPGRGSWSATVSVGTRPTYYAADSVRLAEVHLLDFSGDLYGLTIIVELTGLIRGQAKCASSSELVDLIRADVRATRRLLNAAGSRTSNSRTTLPGWALQRVTSALSSLGVPAEPRHTRAVAAKAGVNHRLARRALRRLASGDATAPLSSSEPALVDASTRAGTH